MEKTDWIGGTKICLFILTHWFVTLSSVDFAYMRNWVTRLAQFDRKMSFHFSGQNSMYDPMKSPETLKLSTTVRVWVRVRTRVRV